MKKLITSIIVLLSSIQTAHAVTFNNSDGSRLSSICIAAVESDKALQKKARAYGFNQQDLNAFTCNGLTIDAFAKKYRGVTADETIKVYAFERTEDSRETELCVAAATSNDEYKATKARLFKGRSVSKIYCNGLPLDKFARRYGNKAFKQ